MDTVNPPPPPQRTPYEIVNFQVGISELQRIHRMLLLSSAEMVVAKSLMNL